MPNNDFLTGLLVLALAAAAAESFNSEFNFTFNGFQSANLALDADGIAHYTDDGRLMLTNTTVRAAGHAFFPLPLPFEESRSSSSSSSSSSSFSTSFAFAIVPAFDTLAGHGIAFVISPSKDLSGNLPSQYLGLFNVTSNGDPSNHVVAVELDVVQDFEFHDMDDNHVGIDINGMVSVAAASAGYYSSSQDQHNKTMVFNKLSLRSGRPMVLWVDYDAGEKLMNVTLAPLHVGKPKKPLLSHSTDLSPILKDSMYVGFSSSDGLLSGSQYILGWSFALNGPASDLRLSELPKPPEPHHIAQGMSGFLVIGVPLILIASLLLLSATIVFVSRRRKFAEELEDWEIKYGPHRFKYKDLYVATKGFKDKQLLGKGGFGKVYRGVLPDTRTEIAVKRVSHDSKQGIREFVAEIVSCGRLRHRNLVPLLGYCRRKRELLLVYDYMPNGSLDKHLFRQPVFVLSWEHRYSIIKGVASGLLYLHEEWEQVVIHRDIKASNVLLDSDFNARIGDFGLARLHDHGSDPHTTHAAGTIGYLAPEHTTTGRPTRRTDIYAFGAFLLEVACGRRPIESDPTNGGVILVSLVFEHLSKGELLEVIDPSLKNDQYCKGEEVELVLKLGLMCSNVEPMARPTMRQVVQYLEGALPLPGLSGLTLSARGLISADHNDSASLHSYATNNSTDETVLFVGR